MPRSSARRIADSRSAASPVGPQPRPPTAHAPNPRRGSDVMKRGGGPTSGRAPGRIEPLPQEWQDGWSTHVSTISGRRQLGARSEVSMIYITSSWEMDHKEDV